jgi:hypothetical protein
MKESFCDRLYSTPAKKGEIFPSLRRWTLEYQRAAHCSSGYYSGSYMPILIQDIMFFFFHQKVFKMLFYEYCVTLKKIRGTFLNEFKS